jgi:hypothetical protein
MMKMLIFYKNSADTFLTFIPMIRSVKDKTIHSEIPLHVIILYKKKIKKKCKNFFLWEPSH